MHLLPPSHHWKIHPVGSPWSHCLSSPACTACRSLSSRTCRSGTACCSSASQTGNMLPGQREAERCFKKADGRGVSGCVSVDVHLYSTGAAVECGRGPGYSAVTVNLNVDMQSHIKHPVIAANREWEEYDLKKNPWIFNLWHIPHHLVKKCFITPSWPYKVTYEGKGLI